MPSRLTLNRPHAWFGSRLLRIFTPRQLLDPRGPAIVQVAQPRRLALDADRLVEGERFGDRVVVRRRMRADLLELPDVVRLARARPASAATPSRCSRGARRESRCRPARAATCAASSRSSRTRDRDTLNGKCANACAPSTIVWMPRARAIRAMSRTGNSCPVRLVMWQMWMTFVFGVIACVDAARSARRGWSSAPGTRSSSPRSCRGARADPTCRASGRNPGSWSRRRSPGCRSIPSCAICSPSLALRVMASSSVSQPTSAASLRRTCLDVRLERVPHVVDRRLVGDVEVALQRFVDDARARAGVAVVQVDDRAVEREGLLDVAPVASRRRRRLRPRGRPRAASPTRCARASRC